MFYELTTALRYLTRTKSHQGFVSFFTFISIACVTIGVAALIIVLSVMTGFEMELKKKVVGMYAHVNVMSPNSRGIKDWKTVQKIIKKNPHVKSAGPIVSGTVLVKTRRAKGVLNILSVDTKLNEEVTDIKKFLKVGTTDIKDNELILGDRISQKLGARLGDKMRIVTFSEMRTPDGKKFVPVEKTFEVAGIFHTGKSDYDSKFAYATLAAGQELFSLNSIVNAVLVKIDNIDNAAEVKNELQKSLGYNYYVGTWMDMDKSLFGAIQMEKRVMFIILLLISLVASLNIISTLVMTVLEKTKDIGILRSLGATKLSIWILFTAQGMFIALTGVITGVVSGVLIAINVDLISKTVEGWTGFSFFPSDVYYFDKIPSVVVPNDVIFIAFCAIGLCFLGAVFPAILAARVDPVKALRYE